MDKLGEMDEPDKDDINEISIGVDVHGWGKHHPSEDEKKVYNKVEDIPSHISYAIEFTPLYRLKHLPIKLNKKFEMRGPNKLGMDDPFVVEGNKEFTVYEVFGAILSELSFCGHPEERDSQWEDVVDDVKDCRDRMEDDGE